MRSQFSTVAVLALASLADCLLQQPAQEPIPGADTVHGCYKSVGTMTLAEVSNRNSKGLCAGLCRSLSKLVGATNADDCYCGDEYPNKADLVDDSKCAEPCRGIDTEACGGLNAYTVYNIGIRVVVGEAELPSSSSSATSTQTSTTTSTARTSTSPPAQATTTPVEEPTESPNVAGIAAGAVVGVVGAAAIVGGILFWMRRKRNAELEEEHRRNAAVNAFITGGGKPPSSSGGLSMSDSRLDPVMNRRMSDGSIADNQDYSRRILRVGEPMV
ncbi:hypothetical protein GGS23DRAFT_521541 [Durotheca rogersii]|uniref:uncharacterized protein n=1 Tax=Durotheca rogersii TaxID=419775 RepID=UPI00221F5FC4|nr:uncharacterized protein GGS23DRAFT_521541 [Durotheca rogersii]KAI5863932.1 hypothetical protein GGS23DRAFT_521541 [Durotheca rogersii]